MLRRLSTLLCAGVLVAGCGSARGEVVAGVPLVAAGRLTTCTNLPYPPFEYEKDRRVVGFDIDMTGLVAKRLGVRQRVVDFPFEVLKTGTVLNAERCDIVAAALAVTGDRERYVDFSAPYFRAVLCVVVRRGTRVDSLADVRHRRLRVGVQSGTTGADHTLAAGIDPRSYATVDGQLDALRSGQVEVLVQDCPAVSTWLQDPRHATAFTTALTVDAEQDYAFAVRQGEHPGLRRLVDEVIATARRDGTYERLYRKWIGVPPVRAASPEAG
ncbi:Glutamine-binding periplasmic protein precursor [Streptomyces sp. YIM 121038]|uniref:ABC transporter substrate-binding protein n=1 Tax=Streptomyces sp. YIM 121038 TaxID=2136401 RepID=UPI001163B369|nr:ABC transporter substrate-binding protein [Streptomyces sp. YIM 121038]QCX81395.1 Glutamine-binding periplasmic protein precursor [Streptomyces sp. YIM 121038]